MLFKGHLFSGLNDISNHDYRNWKSTNIKCPWNEQETWRKKRWPFKSKRPHAVPTQCVPLHRVFSQHSKQTQLIHLTGWLRADVFLKHPTRFRDYRKLSLQFLWNYHTEVLHLNLHQLLFGMERKWYKRLLILYKYIFCIMSHNR